MPRLVLTGLGRRPRSGLGATDAARLYLIKKSSPPRRRQSTLGALAERERVNTHHVEKKECSGPALFAGWALYTTVVAASNLADLFWSFHWENWVFRSGNLTYIATATRTYFTTEQANQALLALVIVWEGAAAVLLWLAALRWARGGEAALTSARRGLATLGLLWFGFAISTELTVAYDRGVNESANWVLATAVLATVTVLEIWAPLRRAGTGSMEPGVAQRQ